MGEGGGAASNDNHPGHHRLNHPAVDSAQVRGLITGSRGHVELEPFEVMIHLFGNTPGPESDRSVDLMNDFVAKHLIPSAVAPV